jgi:hypothetical protein
MTERTCGECYRCCVAFGISEIKKHQDKACRHLDGRNPTARCSIYANRPMACQTYTCLWRDGHFDEDDRPDKSGVIAHFDTLTTNQDTSVDQRFQLTLTVDTKYERSDATMVRIHEWVADLPISQIMCRVVGKHIATIQSTAGELVTFSYVPVDYEEVRVVHVKQSAEPIIR